MSVLNKKYDSSKHSKALDALMVDRDDPLLRTFDVTRIGWYSDSKEAAIKAFESERSITMIWTMSIMDNNDIALVCHKPCGEDKVLLNLGNPCDVGPVAD